MRISEFKIKKLISLLIPNFAIRNLQLLRYLSLGQQKVLFILALFLLVIIYLRFYHHSPLPPSEENVRECVVEVVGEVQKPGVYVSKNPSTLKEAIQRAGGFKGPAQFDKGSSSETIETGTLVIITKEYPDKIKVRLRRMEARKLLVFSIPLDLNRVTVEDLCLIPGIGESLAREIVTYRERRRGFRSVEELKNVKGIGEKNLRSFQSYLVVRP